MPTVDTNEIDKFSALAHEWWNVDGAFKHLHLMNATRIQYIKQQICSHYVVQQSIPINTLFKEENPLSGLSVLDVGCGGGILSIPLHKLGARVLGIDASVVNINIAQAYADGKMLDVRYKCIAVEDLVPLGYEFDMVCCMEVVEHVADIALLLRSMAKLLKKNGMLFISTINRTVQSYLQAIIAAEYILNMWPKGTHKWQHFIKPSEIVDILAEDMAFLNIQGMKYSFILNEWQLVANTSVNYIMTLKKY